MHDYQVRPRSRKVIREIAHKFRTVAGVGRPRFDILRFIDVVLPDIMDEDITLDINDDDPRLQGNHAYAEPDSFRIVASTAIVRGADQGGGFERMTLAHELGHVILHRGIDPVFARAAEPETLKAYESAEWQAKALAGELMLYPKFLEGHESSAEMAELFGVTPLAAEVQRKVFKNDRLM